LFVSCIHAINTTRKIKHIITKKHTKTLVPENFAIIKPIKATNNAVIRAGSALPS
jgi:hypothetical protein